MLNITKRFPGIIANDNISLQLKKGEIHALLWNGMGMELLWKTRRIKGTVCDVSVADVNNNGKIDLVVSVNSYAGLGSGIKTRCAVYLYPLDTTMVNATPNYQE